MELWKLLQKEYIPSPCHWKEMWINASKRDIDWDWISIDKVSIKKIKIDKKLFAFQNEVDDDQVTYMISNFEEEVWEPILINSDYYLLDGQHRLQLAFRTGMKYIDVIMKKKKYPHVSIKLRAAFRKEEHFNNVWNSILCKKKK